MAQISDISKLRQQQQEKLFKKANVIGMGVGYKESGGQRTDELSLKVLVQEKHAVSALSKKDVVPKEMDGIKTDVIPVGKVVSHQTRRDKWRPAPGGVSIGHYAITAGTLGMIVRDLRTNEPLILSNNHVLANSNDAQIGDAILQPGPSDGGKKSRDKIAELHRFEPMLFQGGGGGGGSDSDCPIAQFFTSILNGAARLVGSKTQVRAEATNAVNSIDAAVAKPINSGVIVEELYELGMPNGTAEAEVGMKVKKSGRTTGLTSGEIIVLDASIDVGYSGRTARFEGQIMTYDMSDPGDSGSVLLDEQNRVVGLLYAGSDTATFYNPIATVLSILQAKID